MLTFKRFTGINNIVPPMRLKGSDLLTASDVDIGLTGEIVRRDGFIERSADCHKNIHQAAGYMLATAGNELVAIWPNGDRYTIYPTLGPERVWYCNLPDGRTTYANGLIQGTTDGVSGRERTVRPPDTLGAPDFAFGDLFVANYRYHLTMRRATDGAESPAVSSQPIAITNGGIRIDGLEVRLGFTTLVYLSTENGDQGYYIGSTSGSTFEWGGKNSDLAGLFCRTIGAQTFPVGTITAFWKGRVLTAVGSNLWASRPMAPHLSDWRDFKPFAEDITAIMPVDDGVYVGTKTDLFFLAGTDWNGLRYQPMERGPVVLGSGVTAPGERLALGEGTGAGTAGLCIAGGQVVAGFNGGRTNGLTEDRYATTATEVCATFRERNGIPQYLAVPQ